MPTTTPKAAAAAVIRRLLDGLIDAGMLADEIAAVINHEDVTDAFEAEVAMLIETAAQRIEA